MIATFSYWSRDVSVGIAMDWTIAVRFPAGGRDFSLLHSIPTGSRVHPFYCLMGTGALSPVVKRPGYEASISFYCRGQEWWIYASSSPYEFMAWF
jgi:hypothetical protein